MDQNILRMLASKTLWTILFLVYCTITYVPETNSPDICIAENKSQILIKLARLFQRGNSWSLLLTQYFDKIKNNEMGRACGMYGEVRVA
jgi:hypothetical protein